MSPSKEDEKSPVFGFFGMVGLTWSGKKRAFPPTP